MHRLTYFTRRSLCLVEIAMGGYMLICVYLAVTTAPAALPFLLLFAAGYLYVGVSSAWGHVEGWVRSRPAADAPPSAAGHGVPQAIG